MARYIQAGDSIDYTPGSDVSAGDVVVVGTIVGVAVSPIAAGALGAIAVTGVFEFPKATGQGTSISAGAACYWDATNGVITTTAQGNTYAGKAVAAAGTSDAVVKVRLSQ